MSLLVELLEKRWQRGSALGQRRFLSGDVQSARVPLFVLALESLQHIAVENNQPPSCGDLRTQRSFGYRRRDDIRRERQACGDQSETALPGLGIQRLDSPSVESKHVRYVRYVHLWCVQTEVKGPRIGCR